MRTLLLFLVGCALTLNLAHAQRHIKGQLALTPYVGIVDNFPSFKSFKADQQGYNFGLDLVRYTRNENYWKIAYQYDVKYYAGLGTILSTDRHSVSFDYALTTLHDHRRTFYIAPLVGGIIGFERVNGNNLDLADGRILNQPSGLLGLQTGLEAEIYFSERTALTLAIQERYLPYSNLSQFRTYGNLGLRFSFFKN